MSDEDLPLLSVVVPACNEEATLEAAVKTLLGSRYPALEVVLVDDRSTDQTGALVDAIAAADPRVRAVHIQELPAGWLGKNHAMHVASQQVSGEYVLYADADVHYGPDCLRRAVCWAERAQLDHMTLLPRGMGGSILVESMMCLFCTLYLTVFRPDRVNRGVAGAYAGVGAFNLVRRSAFEATEGWPWLRLEVADDTGLGLMMSRHGARAGFGMATDDLSIEWYESAAQMVRGLEKNMFIAGLQGSVFVAVLVVTMLTFPIVVLLALLGTSWWWLVLLPGLLCGIGAWALGSRVLAGLIAPYAMPILSWTLIRSTWACLRRGDVAWRGTHYSLDALAEGRRVTIDWLGKSPPRDG